MRDDGRREDVGDGEAAVLRECEDRAEVVGRVPPLSRKPGVVEVEPADERGRVERRLDGIEEIAGGGNAHVSAGAERPEHPPARLVRRGEGGAAERVGEHEARGGERLVTELVLAQRVAGEPDEQRVRLVHRSSRARS